MAANLRSIIEEEPPEIELSDSVSPEARQLTAMNRRPLKRGGVQAPRSWRTPMSNEPISGRERHRQKVSRWSRAPLHGDVRPKRGDA